MSGLIEDTKSMLPPPNYKYITTEEEARGAMSVLDNYPIHSMDIEATALDPYEARWTLLQVGIPDQVFVFDVRHDTEHSSLHPEVLDPMLQDQTKVRIFQNASYDMKVIKRSRGYYLDNIYDTMLIEQLSYLGLGFTKTSLDALVFRHLGLYMSKEPRNTFADYYQKYKPFQLEYAANDVVPLQMIKDLQWPNIQKEGLEGVAQLEFEFLVPLCEMELNGICIDEHKWRKMMAEVKDERDNVHSIIQETLAESQAQATMFGVSLTNIDSPSQLKKALSRYGLPLDSTAEEALKKHQGLPVIDALLDYRKANKLISTYSETLLAKINKVTGRLHTNFRQMVATGRMSSSNPNLQNIPKKQKFRSCFVAKEGYSLLTADMSGAELRILGNLSKDPVFIDAYATGQDLHTRTGSEMFKVAYEEVQKHQRNAAKSVNFGLCGSEDTDIITNLGIKKIKEVKARDKVAHDVGFNEVIDSAFMGQKEVFEIKTKYGYTLEVTADHPMKVINSDGDYVDKKLKDLNLNTDLVCIKNGANLFPHEEVFFDKFEVSKVTNYKHIDLPKKLNSCVAAFLGLFIAEGSVFKTRGSSNYGVVAFGFSKENKEFIYNMDKLFNNLFGHRVSIHDGKYKRYTINSVLFAEWLVTILDIKGHNKTDDIGIPDCIKRSPRKHQVEFLKWLFEGDGTIKKNGKGCKICYSSNSKKLVKDIQTVLLNFGVLSSITIESRSGYDKNYYALSIITVTNELFMSEIGFLTKVKNDKYINLVKHIISSYFVGRHKERIKDVVLNNYVSTQLESRFSESMCGDNVGNIYLKELSKYDEFFDFIYKNNIVPLKIKSIMTKGIKRVYDLAIENHQYFLANGFIVHNCYGMSAVGLSKRLKVSKKEAENLIFRYFNAYKGVKKYLDKAGKDAVRNRHSTTISGRRRYYNMPPHDHPDRRMMQSRIERQGKNAGIQGCLCAGSVIKGIGAIENCVDKCVEIKTGFGDDNAVGVYSGKKGVYNLKLSNGVELGITLDHNIPVVRDNSIVDIPVVELNDKDFILVPLNITDGKVTDISGYDYNCPNVMDIKLSFICGCLLSDNCSIKRNHFRFVCQEHEIGLFAKFNNYIEDLFWYQPEIKVLNEDRKTLLYVSKIRSVIVCEFMKHIGLDCVKHVEKKIPEYFYTETVINKGELLNGLFSINGGMTSKSGPNFTTSSKYLANSVHQLLFTLGINSNLKTYIEKDECIYKIQIPKRFNYKFEQYIGFSVLEKQRCLISENNNHEFVDNSVVPEFIPKTIEKVLHRNSNYLEEFSKDEKEYLRRFKLGKCSFSSWRKFYKCLPDCKEKVMLSKYLNYDFCHIRSLNYRGKEDTYDMMCDNIHYFTANGVIVHNSNADTIKEAMIILVERLKNYDAKLILTVHDEVVVEVAEDQKYEVAPIVAQSLIDGFGKYFTTIPMETDTLIGPSWLKESCSNRPDGKNTCGNTEMKFVPHSKFGTKLVCAKCGADQE